MTALSEAICQQSIKAMREQARPIPDGYLEFQCQAAMRDLLLRHGARIGARLIQQYLDDELARMKP